MKENFITISDTDFSNVNDILIKVIGYEKFNNFYKDNNETKKFDYSLLRFELEDGEIILVNIATGEYVRYYPDSISMDQFQKIVSMRINNMIYKRRMTQKEVALKCNISEVSLSRIIRCKSNTSLETFIKLAEVLSCKVEYFFKI